MQDSHPLGTPRQLSSQLCMSQSKIVAHDVHRPADGLRAFFRGHSAEIPHFDELSQRTFLLCQRIQCEVQFQDPHLRLTDRRLHLNSCAKRDTSTVRTTTDGASGPGMINQNSTHGLGNNRKEVSPIDELNLGMSEKLKISLVHQRCGLQRMIGSLLAEMPFCDTVQCGIRHIHQLPARRFASVAQLPEQLSDVPFPSRDED
jgi:hypothetical protein